MLLFLGFLYAHGSSDASSVHHSSAGSAASAAPAVNSAPYRIAQDTGALSAAPALRTPQQECAHGPESSPHPGEHCLPGHPDQAVVSTSCPRADQPGTSQYPDTGRPPAPGGAARAHGTAAGPSCGVLRI
ncbi:hypothetical protein [Streptomyces sp. NPDC007369]|uniref:hypothetical protein n=1 Tax=Streptomyces sp. NPDC007369 TaxID=3154589 RepID=UPI0033E18FA7